MSSYIDCYNLWSQTITGSWVETLIHNLQTFTIHCRMKAFPIRFCSSLFCATLAHFPYFVYLSSLWFHFYNFVFSRVLPFTHLSFIFLAIHLISSLSSLYPPTRVTRPISLRYAKHTAIYASIERHFSIQWLIFTPIGIFLLKLNCVHSSKLTSLKFHTSLYSFFTTGQVYNSSEA